MSSQYCFSHSLPRCVQGITDHYWPDSDQIRVTCQTRTFVTVTWHVTWQLWHSVNCLQIGNFTLLLFSDLNCGPCPIWPQHNTGHITRAGPGAHSTVVNLNTVALKIHDIQGQSPDLCKRKTSRVATKIIAYNQQHTMLSRSFRYLIFANEFLNRLSI